jgi:hypothetical protein
MGKMSLIRNPQSGNWLVPAILLICLLSAVVHSALAAPLQQKPSAAQKPKSSEETAAKKSDEKNESSGKEAGSDGGPRISLGEITGSPGASLMIPLYYTSSASDPLRSLAVDIEYVGNHLKFQKAAGGVTFEEGKANLSANVTDGVPDAKGTVRSKLRVAVSLTEKNPQTGIPEGLLAFLLFQVTMDAKPFTIKLTPTLASAEDLHTPPRKVSKITTVPGTVVVEIPDVMPMATCFFFSH